MILHFPRFIWLLQWLFFLSKQPHEIFNLNWIFQLSLSILQEVYFARANRFSYESLFLRFWYQLLKHFLMQTNCLTLNIISLNDQFTFWYFRFSHKKDFCFVLLKFIRADEKSRQTIFASFLLIFYENLFTACCMLRCVKCFIS